MTICEAAYQNFTFTKVTFDHREALTPTEMKVLDLHKAGHTGYKDFTQTVFDQHLRVIEAKGWVNV